jgi:hypothetical protein
MVISSILWQFSLNSFSGKISRKNIQAKIKVNLMRLMKWGTPVFLLIMKFGKIFISKQHWKKCESGKQFHSFSR